MERKLSISFILCLLITACGPSGFHEPISSVYVKTESTYVPPTPEISHAGKYEYFEGLSKFSNVSLSIDGATRKADLRGAFVLRPKDGSSAFDIQFDISGLINENYTAILRPNTADTKNLAVSQIEIGAKLTCLYTDCTDSFIDVYIRHKGAIYHHQVEASGRKAGAATAHRAEAPPEKKVTPKSPVKANDPATDEDGDDAEEEEASPDSSSTGYYVGTRESDMKEIFVDTVSGEEAHQENSEPEKGDGGASKDSSATSTHAPQSPSKSAAPVKIPKTIPNSAAPRPLPTKNEPVMEKRDTSVPSMPEMNSKYTAQAIGKPDGGRLVNAVDIYEYTQKNRDAGFSFQYPGRMNHFGTNAMLDMLIQLGKYAIKFINGYELVVNDISARYGGGRGHLSHQTGMDADIGYLFNKTDLQKKFTPAVVRGEVRSEWMVEDQWKLFKYAVKSNNVDRIFIDTVIKKSLCEFATKNGELREGGSSSEAFQTLRVLNPWAGHGNHFHLRIRQDCPAKEPRCFQMVPPPNVTNCK